MNLNEYKVKKIKELKHFLRGINFENIGIKGKPIIGNLTPECSEFFNENAAFRKVTELFLNEVREHYNNLVYTDIELAASKELIDREITYFVEEVRKKIDSYKNAIIKVAFREKKENEESISIEKLPEVREKNLINTALNFIKIKIGDKEYMSFKTKFEAEKEDVTLDNLNIMIVYIYVLVCMINDKKQKKEEFNDFIAENFKPIDPRYSEYLKLQFIFLNEKNYDDFILKYNAVTEEIVSALLEEGLEEEKPKVK